MSLNELLPTVSQLSHQDKLRLIHFLLLQVAREEGCNLKSTTSRDLEEIFSKQCTQSEAVEQVSEDLLLKRLSSTEAVVWSPYEAYEAAKTLGDLLAAARQEEDA